MDKTQKMFKELTEINGPSGFEHDVKDYMKEKMESSVDEFMYDKIGSIIGKKIGAENGPKIMLAGHLDEVGFMVTQITDEGFIKFQTLGGWWSQVMLSQKVTITNRDGKKIRGVIGSKAPHILTPEERNKVMDIKAMHIDLGVKNKEAVENLNIEPGDYITPFCEFELMADENYMLAKAWDNRIGVAIVIDVLTRLKNEKHNNIVYGVGTVQEEVGLRGAKTTSHLIQPDISFSLDVGIAGDTPGVTADQAQGRLGNGPQLMLFDASMVGHRGLRELVVETAKKNNIKFQFDALAGGGTDAGAMHLAGTGAPSMAVTLPTRYIHSNVSILHREDYDAIVNLLVNVIKELDENTVNKLTYGA